MRKVIIDKSILKRVDIFIALLEESLIETHFFIEENTYKSLEEKMECEDTKYKTKNNLEKFFSFLFDIAESDIEKLFNGGVSLDPVLPNKGCLVSIRLSSKKSSYLSIDLYNDLEGEKYIYAIDPSLLMKSLRMGIKVISLRSFSIKRGFRLESHLTTEQSLSLSENKPFVGLMENEVVVFGSKMLVFRSGKLQSFNFKKIEKGEIKPKNLEQKIAMTFLRDENISLFLLTGLFGTGKSFLTIYEFYQGYKENRYKKLILTSSTLGIEDNGYRPGTEKDKVRGCLDSVKTTLIELKEITKDPLFDKMIKDFEAAENLEPNGILKIMPLNDTQGQTYRDSLMFFDEAQNATEAQIKEFLTRTGKGSKVVLAGDVSQVRETEKSLVTKYNNGLLAAERRMRGESLVAVLYSDKAETRGVVPAMVARVYK